MESISAFAADLRDKCGFADAYNLDVFGILRRLERSELKGKGRLRLISYNGKPRGFAAYVSHNPLELHVERLTLERARWGADANSKYILAHELGHIVLHDQLAVPFSGADFGSRITGTEEEQAEWQANTFADYLLLPDNVLASFSTVDEIVEACGVNRGLAERRLPKKKSASLYLARYSGEACPECQNFTLTSNKHVFECETCGATVLAVR